jgi:hypothetical protein
MDLEFKEAVWKGQFKPTEESLDFEDKFRKTFGLQNRYDTARLLIGRSLADWFPVWQAYCPKVLRAERRLLLGQLQTWEKFESSWVL